MTYDPRQAQKAYRWSVVAAVACAMCFICQAVLVIFLVVLR